MVRRGVGGVGALAGVLAFGLWVTAGAGGAELLANGGFEEGVGNDADGWTELIVGQGSTLERVSGAGVGGGFAMAGSVAWVSGTGTKTEVRQGSATGSVQPGESYVLSFLAKGRLGPGGVAWFELFWISSGGGVVGTSGLGNIFATLTEDYTVFGGTYTAPAGAESVVVSIRLEGGAFAGSSGELSVDGVSLTGNAVDPGPEGELGFDIAREVGMLVFRWNGRAGKVYDLRSNTGLEGDPALWPLLLEGILANPGVHEESVALPADPAGFYVLVERDG